MRFFSNTRKTSSQSELPLHYQRRGKGGLDEDSVSSSSSQQSEQTHMDEKDATTSSATLFVDDTMASNSSGLPFATALHIGQSSIPCTPEEGDFMQDIELETEEERQSRQLAWAWILKRQRLKRQSQLPVDVDSLMEWNSTPILPTIEEDNATAVSAATSDQTPVVSNLGPPSKKRSRRNRVMAAPRPLPPTATTTTTALVVQHTTTTPTDQIPKQEERQHSSSGFFDIRTKHGKLVYFLLVLLLLAVTTMVVSALVTGQTKSSPRGNSPFDLPLSTATTAPSTSPPLVTVSTPSPSVETTSPNSISPTTFIPSSMAPSVAHTHATHAPSTSPSRVTPTHETHAPSTSPSHVTPTHGTHEPSTSPSHVPTHSPSHTPFLSPSQVPSTLPPTEIPSEVPTLAPSTLAPTKSFESLQISSTDLLSIDAVEAHYGSAVAFSANGQVMAAGAPNLKAGVVQVYERDSTDRWKPRGPPLVGTTDKDTFGTAVALNSDGSILAVSEPRGSVDRAGNVRVYQFADDTSSYEALGQELSGRTSPAHFGVGLALSESGQRLAVGAPYQTSGKNLRLNGEVYVYELVNGDEWRLMGEPLLGSGTLDWFGSAVDLADQGWTVLASAPRSPKTKGYVQVWTWNNESKEWKPLGTDMVNTSGKSQHSDRFGHSISFSRTKDDGVPRIAVGTPMKDVDGVSDAGMVEVYERLPGEDEWTLVGDVIVPDAPAEGARFGYSVKLLNGNILAVGAPDTNAAMPGLVQIYNLPESSQNWQKHPETVEGLVPGDGFGHSLALATSREGHFSLAVGATQASNGGSGYVLVYDTE